MNYLSVYVSLGFGSFGTPLGSTGITTAPPNTFNLGSFGSTAPTGGLFGQQTQAPAPVQQTTTPVESVLSSVLYCNVYGDERDAILARWNLLQAAWGTGKGQILIIRLYVVFVMNHIFLLVYRILF